MTQITEYKRSNEPFFWFWFGFGGMVIAFALPALLICMLIAGFTDGHSFFHLTEAMSHWWGAGALFIIIFGVACHSAHRIYYSLRDLGVKTGKIHHVVIYSLALLLSIASAAMLGIYYFGSV